MSNFVIRKSALIEAAERNLVTIHPDDAWKVFGTTEGILHLSVGDSVYCVLVTERQQPQTLGLSRLQRKDVNKSINSTVTASKFTVPADFSVSNATFTVSLLSGGWVPCAVNREVLKEKVRFQMKDHVCLKGREYIVHLDANLVLMCESLASESGVLLDKGQLTDRTELDFRAGHCVILE